MELEEEWKFMRRWELKGTIITKCCNLSEQVEKEPKLSRS